MTTKLQFPAAFLTMKHEQNRTRCIYYLTLVCYHPMLPPQLRAFKNIFFLQICSEFPTFSFIKPNTTKYLQKYSTPVTSICNGFSVDLHFSSIGICYTIGRKIVAFKYLKIKNPKTTKQRGNGKVLNLIQFPKEVEKGQEAMF